MLMRLNMIRDSFTAATRPLRLLSLEDLEKFSLFHARATAIKESLHALKSIREKNSQDKEAYLGLKELMEHDFVSYLIITKQYYLLNQLFEDPDKKASWLALLEEMDYKDERQKRRLRDEWVEFTQAKIKQQLSQIPHSSLTHDPFEWNHPKPYSTELEQWAHYAEELTRITFNYHKQRAELHQRDFEDYFLHLNNVLYHIEGNEQHYELRQHIEHHRERFDRRRHEIGRLERFPLGHPMGIEAEKRHEEYWSVLKHDIHLVVHELHSHPSAKNETLAHMYQQMQPLFKRHDVELNQLDEHYTQAQSELKALIEVTKSACINSTLEKINATIERIAQENEGLVITPHEQSMLDSCVQRLTQLKEHLVRIKNPSEASSLFSDIDKELKHAYQILTKCVIHSQSNRINPAPEGGVLQLNVDNEQIAINDADSPLSKPEDNQNELLMDAASASSAINRVQQMRSQMQLIRGVDPVSILLREMTTLIDEKLESSGVKRTIKEQLEDLKDEIGPINPNEHLDIDMQKLIAIKECLEPLTKKFFNFKPIDAQLSKLIVKLDSEATCLSLKM